MSCFWGVFFPDGNLTRSRGLLLLSKKEITSTSTSVFQYLTGVETLFDRGYLQAEVRRVLLVLVLFDCIYCQDFGELRLLKLDLNAREQRTLMRFNQ